VLLNCFKVDAALAVLEPAAAELADLADDPRFVALDGQLARAYFLHDDHRRAIEVADRVLEPAERLDLVEIVADTLITKGSALGSVGRTYEGMGAIEAGERLAEANGLWGTAGRGLNNRSAFLSEDDPRAAVEACRALLVLCRRFGYRLSTPLDNMAGAALHLGDWDTVIGELEAALQDEANPYERAVLQSNLLAFRAARGEPFAGERAEVEAGLEGSTEGFAASLRRWCGYWESFPAGRLEEARTVCRDVVVSWAQYAVPARLFAARAALWMGDLGGARADLEELEGLSGIGRSIKAGRIGVRAGVAALEGRRSDALALYREALRAWRDLGCAWDEALTGIDMATLLDPAEPEVQAAAERAREILVRLRARPFLERLEAAMARTIVPGVPA